MRKQTKLVAVLSTAALLAIGASMTSFAAQGWAEEDGTWVYYDRNGDRVTDKWAKSGNNWYYLDSDGEMAIDTLIEDGDNYYYVDINGVMASNQWVAIENEDAGDDDEPENYWYYFQSNGKALTNGNNSNVALKTINGKKYAFDEEGKMLFGWVAKDSAERIDNTDGDGFKTGDYYFGDENDGAMTVGWLQMDITYDEATSDYEFAPVFNDDEDQTRWFYFQSNGKKVKADGARESKDKTINGKKYSFDQYGAMTAEWSLDREDADNLATPLRAHSDNTTATGNSVNAQYAKQWRYFNSVEDGSRVSKGWFKVVAAEWLNNDKFDDDEDSWYYADGSGNLYAGEFKTIKGKKYAFRDDGRMVDSLKFIKDTGSGLIVAADDGSLPYATEDEFNTSAPEFEYQGYGCYYFGDGNDGSMKTNKISVDIDGDKFNFYFQKSGSKKGAGLTGEKDKKYYQSGKLLAAGKDEKYQVVSKILGSTTEKGYKKLDDVDAFKTALTSSNYVDYSSATDAVKASKLASVGVNKKGEDIKDLILIKDANGVEGKGQSSDNFFLVNTSGKVIDNKTKSTDGNDYVYVTAKGGKILAIYSED